MTHSTRYRMYVDESGDHVMEPSKWSTPDARYLGLTGVVIASETYRTHTHPDFEALKQKFFPHDPDYPVILVRQKITQKRGIFRTLQDAEVATQWEGQILQFLESNISHLITVVMDKEAYGNTESQTTQQPYSHCVCALTIEYSQWLHKVGGSGDVMIESRRGKADSELREFYTNLMSASGAGSETHLPLDPVGSELKLERKSDNITGLQLADLIAYSSTRGILLENARPLAYPPSPATLRFIEAMQTKYDQNSRLLVP